MNHRLLFSPPRQPRLSHTGYSHTARAHRHTDAALADTNHNDMKGEAQQARQCTVSHTDTPHSSLARCAGPCAPVVPGAPGQSAHGERRRTQAQEPWPGTSGHVAWVYVRCTTYRPPVYVWRSGGGAVAPFGTGTGTGTGHVARVGWASPARLCGCALAVGLSERGHPSASEAATVHTRRGQRPRERGRGAAGTNTMLHAHARCTKRCCRQHI
jgi:hypothetical protein